MEDKLDTIDRRIDEIARRQHGVVTLRQLEAVGLGRRGASKRAGRGRLHRVHRGVYAVGHRGLSLHGRFMAAVLVCGEGAVLSHGSAAVLWRLLRPLDGPIHVSVPSASGRAAHRGVQVHRTQTLAESSPSPSYLQQEGGRRGRLLTTRRDNIPVTTVARTIEDLRSTAFPPRLLRRATRQAELMGYRLDGIATDRTRSDLKVPAAARLFLRNKGATLSLYSVPPAGGDDAGPAPVGAGDVSETGPAGLVGRRRSFTDKQLEKEPGRVVADVARALAKEVPVS